MIKVNHIDVLRNGGSILFSLEDSVIDGYYELQSPFLSNPQLLCKFGEPLSLGGSEESLVSGELSEWLLSVTTEKISKKIFELESKKLKIKQSELSELQPIILIRKTVEILNERKET